MANPEACTACGTPVSLTPDWTLWPWPDGAKLCSTCNETRHDGEEYDAVAATIVDGTQTKPLPPLPPTRIMSFGYKYGAPQTDTAPVIDLRPLMPNPWKVKGLRNLNGQHPKVQEWLSCQIETRVVLDLVVKLVAAGYRTIYVGCQGGQHRSVYIAEQAMAIVPKLAYVEHRDIHRTTKRKG